MITPTRQSLELTKYISEKIENLTFHLHYHILYDIAKSYPTEYELNYLEIGCYGGGSASLIIQRPRTRVVTVDLGGPITMEVAVNNITKLNIHNNEVEYIKGNSHKPATLDMVREIMDEVDILFIDGDHSYAGVLQDFNMYSPLVTKNGYIVFDDYLDSQFSPEVGPAVDDILKKNNFIETEGPIPNIWSAPSILKDNSFNNCLVVQKCR